MALNAKKIETRNKADELIAQLQEAERKENAVDKTIAKLESVSPVMPAPEPMPVRSHEEYVHKENTPRERVETRRVEAVAEPKKKVGRKKMDETQKRRAYVLTLSPATIARLNEQAEGKSRNSTVYVSEYVERYLEDILNSF